MLVFLGTNQAWSVFVDPLKAVYNYDNSQMQFIFNTATFVFCTMIIIAGRLHDRFGPRILAAACAVITLLSWGLAWMSGGNYFLLWFSVGVLASTGSAVGYVCPIATAIKWFPKRRGLVSGLTAAGFAGGPILLSQVSELLMGHKLQWQTLSVFGLIAVTYTPAIFITGMSLGLPQGQPGRAELDGFNRRALVRDKRFWTLFVGMFTGTLPYLVVMGNAKPLAKDFGLGEAAALAITVIAIGNACGRIFWGYFIDKLGPRKSMIGAQWVVIVSSALMILLGSRHPWFFFASGFGIAFCYGSNFAIYPATVTRLYGAHVLGSVYPFIMAAQAISSFAPTINGYLKDLTHSNYPGLIFAFSMAVIGNITCIILSRSISEKVLLADPAVAMNPEVAPSGS